QGSRPPRRSERAGAGPFSHGLRPRLRYWSAACAGNRGGGWWPPAQQRTRPERRGKPVDERRVQEDTAERREGSARHALHAFRERRRRRRAEDTYYGSVDAL